MHKQELHNIKARLLQIEESEKGRRERLRKQTVDEVRVILKEYFAAFPGTQVFLFGSLIEPGQFHQASDVDIAVANHPENRIDLYAALSVLIQHPIDIVVLEKCLFADSIREHGIQVL